MVNLPARTNRSEQSDLLSGLLQYSTLATSLPLIGGFRSETELHSYHCQFVVKRAAYSELIAQSNYLRNLPGHLQSLFVPFLSLEAQPGDITGTVIMPYFNSQTLHEKVFCPETSVGSKRNYIVAALAALQQLHSYRQGTYLRSLPSWIDSIESRFNRNSSADDGITSTLAQLRTFAQFDQLVPGRLLHGDAQAGNILVGETGQIKFIDPLGGSGMRIGDWLYDLSRLYHWLDFAGDCFELSRHNDAFCPRTKPLILAIIDDRFAAMRETPQDTLWFYIYAAFHASGKLSNFVCTKTRQLTHSSLHHYLVKALSSAHDIAGGDQRQ